MKVLTENSDFSNGKQKIKVFIHTAAVDEHIVPKISEMIESSSGADYDYIICYDECNTFPLDISFLSDVSIYIPIISESFLSVCGDLNFDLLKQQDVAVLPVAVKSALLPAVYRRFGVIPDISLTMRNPETETAKQLSLLRLYRELTDEIKSAELNKNAGDPNENHLHYLLGIKTEKCFHEAYDHLIGREPDRRNLFLLSEIVLCHISSILLGNEKLGNHIEQVIEKLERYLNENKNADDADGLQLRLAEMLTRSSYAYPVKVGFDFYTDSIHEAFQRYDTGIYNDLLLPAREMLDNIGDCSSERFIRVSVSNYIALSRYFRDSRKLAKSIEFAQKAEQQASVLFREESFEVRLCLLSCQANSVACEIARCRAKHNTLTEKTALDFAESCEHFYSEMPRPDIGRLLIDAYRSKAFTTKNRKLKKRYLIETQERIGKLNKDYPSRFAQSEKEIEEEIEELNRPAILGSKAFHCAVIVLSTLFGICLMTAGAVILDFPVWLTVLFTVWFFPASMILPKYYRSTLRLSLSLLGMIAAYAGYITVTQLTGFHDDQLKGTVCVGIALLSIFL